jgi:hypothetical protein
MYQPHHESEGLQVTDRRWSQPGLEYYDPANPPTSVGSIRYAASTESPQISRLGFGKSGMVETAVTSKPKICGFQQRVFIGLCVGLVVVVVAAAVGGGIASSLNKGHKSVAVASVRYNHSPK